jgi:N-acetylglucosamine-6-phosphate deacetylase
MTVVFREANVVTAGEWMSLAVWPLSEMATLNPARAMELTEKSRSIAVGMDADLVVLEGELEVCATLVQGHLVHGNL